MSSTLEPQGAQPGPGPQFSPLERPASHAGGQGHSLALVGIALAALATYAPGILGGFIFDDVPNLDRLKPWLEGLLSWQAVVFENDSGPTGRPLTMASFVLNAALGGLEPVGYKLFNVLLHCLNAVLVLVLTRHVLRNLIDSERSGIWAILFSAAWALHPQHVASVLYIVQRMALLSTLFCLCACLAYLWARDRLAQRRVDGALVLWLGIPLLVTASVLSKENGAITPLLILLLELAMPRQGAQPPPRPRQLVVWHGLMSGMLVVAGTAYFVSRWRGIQDAYLLQGSSMVERVLTESRVLWDYARVTLIPDASRIGLFHDDYLSSTGLVDPPATLFAILGWVLAVAIAWVSWRRGHRLVALGLGWFGVGHALESSVLPLETYFIHRNYLPSIGVFWAVAGIAGLASRALDAQLGRSRIPVLIAAVGAIVLLALTCAGEASVWRSNERVLRQAVLVHPDSARAHAMLATELMGRAPYEEVDAHLALAEHLSEDERAAHGIMRVVARCRYGQAVTSQAIADLAGRMPTVVTNPTASAFVNLSAAISGQQCAGLGPDDLATLGRATLARSKSPLGDASWRIELELAQMEAARGRWDAAAVHAERAWQRNHDELRHGLILLQVYMQLGDRARARALADDLARRLDRGWDRPAAELLARLRAALD